MPKPPSSTVRPSAAAAAQTVSRAVDPARVRGALLAFLVLIPLAYLALLAFLGWLFVWHVYQAFASLSAGPYFLFHLPMALLGGLLTLFLIKPVFFRRHSDDDAVLTLTREEEPFLFAFV